MQTAIRSCWNLVRLAGIVLLCCGVTNRAAARDHLDGFDSTQTSWSVNFDKTQVRELSHRRLTRATYAGPACEAFEWSCLTEQSQARVELAIPRARVIDELTAGLWIRSNRDGAQLAVRVVFPHQKLPGSSDLLAVVIDGDRYSAPGTWQQLTCSNIPQEVRRKLPQLRSRLLRGADQRRDLDLTGLYIDRIYVRSPLSRGTVELFVDELKIGPIVAVDHDNDIQLAQAEQAVAPRELEQRLDRLLFHQKPFFPRMVPHHGELPGDLANLHFNLVWVANAEDRVVLGGLRQAGLRAVATPPRALSDDGQTLSSQQASLAPFGSETDDILFWMLGSEISGSMLDQVVTWGEQVRFADRKWNRPVTADVSARLRSYSRQMNMLGVSRRSVHSSMGFRDTRDWLLQRRQLAQPGTLLWTTVHTEGEPLLGGSMSSLRTVLEPEQIRLQVYTALTAGYRGISYWTETSLMDSAPGAAERRLQIQQLNMELELLEPWLATGTLQTQSQITVSIPKSGNFSQLNIDFGTSERARVRRRELIEEHDDYNRRAWALGRELQAASLRSDYGQLLLPVWFGDGSQYVPDQQAANDTSVIIPGGRESDSVYEVSTTDIRNISPPRKERVTGGLKITLDKFDLTAAIVLTEDRALVERLRSKMQSMRASSAQITLDLARAKLQRVSEVDQQLHQLGVGQGDAARLLASAQNCLDRSATMLAQKQYHESRLLSQNCMQLLRILQRAYWNDAVRNLSSPVVSPYAVCFQTLPEHWEFVRRLGRASTQPSINLLPSGDFEDFDELLADGLKHEQHPQEGIVASADHYPKSLAGKYCLRLRAYPERGLDPPAVVADSPIRVTSPTTHIEGRKLVLLQALIKMPKAPVGSAEGLLVYDTSAGRSRAVRITNDVTGWMKVELLREITTPTDLGLTFELSGLGEVLIDEVKIMAFPLPSMPRITTPLSTPPDTQAASTFDFLRKLPGVSTLERATRRSGSPENSSRVRTIPRERSTAPTEIELPQPDPGTRPDPVPVDSPVDSPVIEQTGAKEPLNGQPFPALPTDRLHRPVSGRTTRGPTVSGPTVNVRQAAAKVP